MSQRGCFFASDLVLASIFDHSGCMGRFSIRVSFRVVEFLFYYATDVCFVITEMISLPSYALGFVVILILITLIVEVVSPPSNLLLRLINLSLGNCNLVIFVPPDLFLCRFGDDLCATEF